jgi:hypothetical protein
MRPRLLLLCTLLCVVLCLPTTRPRAQAAVPYMLIITPQDQWIQPGEAKFFPTQFCFLARDDEEALFTAHAMIHHKLLPQLPPQVAPQLKFKLLRDIPLTLCPGERLTS